MSDPTPATTTTTAATPDAVSTATTIKPGHKTSEFYLTLAAIVLSACFATDLFPTGSLAAKLGMIAALSLGSLGYTVVRGNVKTSAMLVLVVGFGLGLGLATSSMGCKPYLPPSAAPIIDCINGDRAEIDPLIAKFWPTDGSAPNWSSIESAAVSAGLNVGGCFLSEFVQKYLTPAPGNHAPAPGDGMAGRKTLEDFRAKHAGGATFHTKLGDL